MLTMLRPRATVPAAHIRATEPRARQEQRAGQLGRIFHLRPFAEASPAVTNALLDLGRRGGRLTPAMT
jgi:hypothetical protein